MNQEDYSAYFHHDASTGLTTSEADATTFSLNTGYSHPTYPSVAAGSLVSNCMYEQHAYAEHQGNGAANIYLPWSHVPHSNMGRSMLQRNYHYGNPNNYRPLQQQPTSPEERSDSAQSYASSPSCASLQSPAQSPAAAVATVAGHFAYSSCSSSRSNSNCNSPAEQVQHQASYQELYSPVRPYFEF